jgi:EmrB/QacA subfamily drug resistance transporter
VVGIGTLLAAMGTSTTSLALPVLARDFGVAVGAAGWVMLAYLVTVTALLLPAGRAGDLRGHRPIYLIGAAGFGAASLAAGLVPNFPLLVAARVLQGVGAAMTFATGPALLTTTFPGAQRGRALGMLATATYVGLSLGPPLGGVLIAAFGWRSVFLLNVPIAAVIVALGARYLPPGGRRAVPFDRPGAALLVTGLPPALLALAQGHKWGWTDPRTLGCAAIGLIALAGFVRIERERPHPLLRLSLFRSPTFSGATASALSNYVALFVAIFLMPFYVLEGKRLDPSHAGLLLAAQPVLMAISASPSGWLSDRVGSRVLATSGMLVLAAGTAGLATVGPATPAWAVMAWLAVTGLGTGVFISPNSSALMGAAPRELQGTAGGVLAVARNLGMMIGVATGGTVFEIAGGHTGVAWGPASFAALRTALLVAAAVALVGAGIVLRFGKRASARAA